MIKETIKMWIRKFAYRFFRKGLKIIGLVIFLCILFTNNSHANTVTGTGLDGTNPCIKGTITTNLNPAEWSIIANSKDGAEAFVNGISIKWYDPTPSIFQVTTRNNGTTAGWFTSGNITASTHEFKFCLYNRTTMTTYVDDVSYYTHTITATTDTAWYISSTFTLSNTGVTSDPTPTPTQTPTPTPTPTPILNNVATDSAGWNTFQYQSNTTAGDDCTISYETLLWEGTGLENVIPKTYFTDGIFGTADCTITNGKQNKQVEARFGGIYGNYIPTPDSFIGSFDLKIRIKGKVNDMDIKFCTMTAPVGDSPFPTVGTFSESACVSLVEAINIDTNNFYDLEYTLNPSDYLLQAEHMTLTNDNYSYGIYLFMNNLNEAQYFSIDSMQIKFTTDTGKYYSNLNNNGNETTPTQNLISLPKFDCGVFQVACDAFTGTLEFIIGIFIPNNLNTDKITNLQSQFEEKLPFAYVMTALSLGDSLNATETASLTTFDVPWTTATIAGTLSVANTIGLTIPAFAYGWFSWVNGFIAVILWVLFIFYWVHRFKGGVL